jgi:hypothetical protein
MSSFVVRGAAYVVGVTIVKIPTKRGIFVGFET